jgi:hypothetical protein
MPSVIDSVSLRLPKDFPATVAGPILEGLKKSQVKRMRAKTAAE